jgi:hypothetical protein
MKENVEYYEGFGFTVFQFLEFLNGPNKLEWLAEEAGKVCLGANALAYGGHS